MNKQSNSQRLVFMSLLFALAILLCIVSGIQFIFLGNIWLGVMNFSVALMNAAVAQLCRQKSKTP